LHFQDKAKRGLPQNSRFPQYIVWIFPQIPPDIVKAPSFAAAFFIAAVCVFFIVMVCVFFAADESC